MWHWYDKGEEWLAILLLGGTSLTMFISSTARAVGSPFAGGAELAQFLFIWTAVLGADITLRHGGQVRIDALVIRLPAKLQFMITSLCIAMMLLFFSSSCLVWLWFSHLKLAAPNGSGGAKLWLYHFGASDWCFAYDGFIGTSHIR
ncbi:hypothetical protein DK37_15210 [Halomonas sp. SUBG004]|nr:hypothetical protein DK37_15210 [Halomonas sp. SUBG004]